MCSYLGLKSFIGHFMFYIVGCLCQRVDSNAKYPTCCSQVNSIGDFKLIDKHFFLKEHCSDFQLGIFDSLFCLVMDAINPNYTNPTLTDIV